MRLLADLIRGIKADKALFILKVHEKKMYSLEMEKLLLSAISNWKIKNDGGASDENELFVQTVTVDSGRMLKRIQPAPQGRAHRVRKRSNHITIVVSDGRIDEIRPKGLNKEIEANEVTEEETVNQE